MLFISEADNFERYEDKNFCADAKLDQDLNRLLRCWIFFNLCRLSAEIYLILLQACLLCMHDTDVEGKFSGSSM